MAAMLTVGLYRTLPEAIEGLYPRQPNESNEAYAERVLRIEVATEPLFIDVLKKLYPENGVESIPGYAKRLAHIQLAYEEIPKEFVRRQREAVEKRGEKFVAGLEEKAACFKFVMQELKNYQRTTCAFPCCSKNRLFDVLRRCSRCRKAFYCGMEHQRLDWKRHRVECVKNACKADPK